MNEEIKKSVERMLKNAKNAVTKNKITPASYNRYLGGILDGLKIAGLIENIEEYMDFYYDHEL